MPAAAGRAVDWLFRSRTTGRITIAQFPNLPLWIFFAAVIVQRIAGEGTLGTAADLTASAALGWWAIDEVARGVNPWRRILGVAGIAYTVFRLVNSF